MGRKRRNRDLSDLSEQGRNQRRLRVGEALRHALAQIFRNGECRDPALHDIAITVSEVSVSPDLRSALAYVMPLGGAHAEETIAALERCTPFLRGRLAREVPLRYTPQLSFALDRSFDHAERIAELLTLPEVARDLGPDETADRESDEQS